MHACLGHEHMRLCCAKISGAHAFRRDGNPSTAIQNHLEITHRLATSFVSLFIAGAMAEILGIVTGSFSVVAFAGQLAKSAAFAHDFICNIKRGPDELYTIAQEIKTLQSNFYRDSKLGSRSKSPSPTSASA